MGEDERYLRVETTTSSAEDARRLAGALVERRLVACAQIVGPIRSVYRWEGSVRHDDEFLVVLKTRAALLGAIEQALADLHPYDVPEVLAVDVAAGARPYLTWIDEQTGPA